jgi:hypothetical protein
MTSATADGWRVAALPGRPYPVLVPGDNQARGMLITGLTHDEWQTLDSFEVAVYELVSITLTDGRNGWAYARTDNDEALPNNWDIDDVARRPRPANVDGSAVSFRAAWTTAADRQDMQQRNQGSRRPDEPV